MKMYNKIPKEKQQSLLEALYAVKRAPRLLSGICVQVGDSEDWRVSLYEYVRLRNTLQSVLGPREYHINVPESRLSMESQYDMVLWSIEWEYTNQFILKRMELLNSLIYTLEDSLGIVG